MQIKDLILFENLNEEELESSLACSQSAIQSFKKGELIYHEEDKPGKLYFILEGSVELGQNRPMGRLANLEHLTQGQAFGEIELFLEHDTHTHYAKAETAVRVLAVSRHFFKSTCTKNCTHHNKIIYNMLRLFAQEAEKNIQKLQLLTSGTLRQRIAYYLMNQSKDCKTIVMSMKREELAAHLNTTRPSLSRELSAMQKEELIKIVDRAHIQIRDFSLLQKEIDGVFR